MDGEHAYSAAIVLVMINIAFPRNLRDSEAMDTALSVLREMAEKGNGHIRARYNLLLNLKSMMKSFPTTTSSEDASSRSENSSSQDAAKETTGNIKQSSTGSAHIQTNTSSSFPINASSEAFDDIFSFENTVGDVRLWEECYGNIDMDMDFAWTHWSENSREHDVL
jgi:proline utilization trans-activator